MAKLSTSRRLAGIVAAVFLMLGAGPALAQGSGGNKAGAADAKAPSPVVPRIAIVNVDYAMNESKAVQSVQGQMKSFSDKYRKEIDAEEAKLRQQDQELQQQRAILAPEAYAQRREEFQKKVAALQQKARALRQAMDKGYKDTMQRIQKVLFEEVGKLANEMGFNLVLASSQVIVTINDFNITPQAIERLNKRLPDVKLTMEEKKPDEGEPAAKKR